MPALKEAQKAALTRLFQHSTDVNETHFPDGEADVQTDSPPPVRHTWELRHLTRKAQAGCRKSQWKSRQEISGKSRKCHVPGEGGFNP